MGKFVWVEAAGLVLGVYLAIPWLITVLTYALALTTVYMACQSLPSARTQVGLGGVTVPVPPIHRYIRFGIPIIATIVAIVIGFMTWDAMLGFVSIRMGQEPPKNRYIHYRLFNTNEKYQAIIEFGIRAGQINEPYIELDVGANYDESEMYLWFDVQNRGFGISPTAHRFKDADYFGAPPIFKRKLANFSIRPDRSLYLFLIADTPFQLADCRVEAQYDVPKLCSEGDIEMRNITDHP